MPKIQEILKLHVNVAKMQIEMYGRLGQADKILTEQGVLDGLTRAIEVADITDQQNAEQLVLTKPPVAKPATRGVKQILADIADCINSRGEGADLWDILTALRGPDDNDHDYKMKTSARIRGAIGLKSSNFFISHEPPEKISNSDLKDGPGTHFNMHYNHAVSALSRLKLIGESNENQNKNEIAFDNRGLPVYRIRHIDTDIS